MTERWLPIGGFEWAYEISDFGNLRSIDRLVKCKRRGYIQVKGKLIKLHCGNSGYLQAILCNEEGAHINVMIHLLVLEAFVSTRPDNLVACHNDGIKTNNHYKNLRWDTHANNLLDKIRHDTHQFGEKNPCAKLSAKQVSEIKEQLKLPYRGLGRILAKQYNVTPSTISLINVSKNWSNPLSTKKSL